MNGIINVLKPPGMTSFDVVAYLRRLMETRKIGHAGTLDPMAAGVLPVCAGSATKAIEFLMDKDKFYRTELTLGITTDTQDSSGRALSFLPPECSDEEIEKAVQSFTGVYFQMPPMYSAMRVNGKRLYELARGGVEIERQKRAVEVYSARVLDINRKKGVKALIDVHCSKGTYIRTLCADIGERLRCGGHMSFLLRKKAGCFDIDGAHTLEELEERRKAGSIGAALIPTENVFGDIPGYTLDPGSERKFRNGMCVRLREEAFAGREKIDKDRKGDLIRVYDASGQFIAVGTIRSTESGYYLKVKKFFSE